MTQNNLKGRDLTRQTFEFNKTRCLNQSTNEGTVQQTEVASCI